MHAGLWLLPLEQAFSSFLLEAQFGVHPLAHKYFQYTAGLHLRKRVS